MLVLPAHARAALRRNVRTACEVVTDSGFRLIGRRTLDVSPEGLLFECAVPGETASLGEEVIVAFRSPIARRWFDALGRVTRFVHGRRGGERAAMAVEFHHMDEGESAILAGHLRGIAPRVPTRKLRMDYAAQVRSIWAAGDRHTTSVIGR